MKSFIFSITFFSFIWMCFSYRDSES